MNIIPIVFAFDRNWSNPACVCLFSLMENAHKTTFYDIFILHSKSEPINKVKLDIIPQHFNNCRIQYIEVDNIFDHSFEIRGITTSTYYRLLIPLLIRQYDKIIYSDVDVIFRNDLWSIYNSTDLSDAYIAGVNTLSHCIPDLKQYYEKQIRIDPSKIIYAGNIILNSKAMREDGIIDVFIRKARESFRFQDMDIINIVCSGKIKYLPPSFCVTTYFYQLAIENREILARYWSDNEIKNALKNGTVHYNGQKPWKGYCLNFDIWWEYYRKSPFFDEKFYFDFFYRKLDEFDTLPLWKRIKILLRYFVYGKKTF